MPVPVSGVVPPGFCRDRAHAEVVSKRTSAVGERQEVQMEAGALQKYDEWLAVHMQELVDRYPSKVVAIHEDQVVFIGDSEGEVYRWVHKTVLTPMPLVFRVPRAEDLDTIL
jgi:hypothetical protein